MHKLNIVLLLVHINNGDGQMIDLTSKPEGMQLVSEVAIAWLCDNHPEVYAGFYERVDAVKQKSERELFIDAAKKSASLRARDGAETIYGELFDAGFKAPKVGE